jgi:hypothetical protein
MEGANGMLHGVNVPERAVVDLPFVLNYELNGVARKRLRGFSRAYRDRVSVKTLLGGLPVLFVFTGLGMFVLGESWALAVAAAVASTVMQAIIYAAFWKSGAYVPLADAWEDVLAELERKPLVQPSSRCRRAGV